MSTNKGGAPLGNKNAAKGRMWTEALRRIICRSEEDLSPPRTLLDKAAQALVMNAVGGDNVALKELGDRLEGRPTQIIEATVETVELDAPQRPVMTREQWLAGHGLQTH